jgi:hypothetical protein
MSFENEFTDKLLSRELDDFHPIDLWRIKLQNNRRKAYRY